MSKLSAKIVDEIERDIKDRGGLDDVWCWIDEDTREDIIGTWMDIIDEALERKGFFPK